MGKKDWKRFFKWCAERCQPIDHTPKPEPVPVDKKGRPIKVEKPEVDKDNMNKMAQPLRPVQKYVYPKKVEGPYIPTIDPKKPAKLEKTRPVKPPKIPCCFPNDEIKGFFFYTLRYTISPWAMKCKAKPRTIELAKPRVIPPAVNHCPIPEVEPEYIPPRTKMTYRQWKAHQRRLEYLAKPRIWIDIYNN